MRHLLLYSCHAMRIINSFPFRLYVLSYPGRRSIISLPFCNAADMSPLILSGGVGSRFLIDHSLFLGVGGPNNVIVFR